MHWKGASHLICVRGCLEAVQARDSGGRVCFSLQSVLLCCAGQGGAGQGGQLGGGPGGGAGEAAAGTKPAGLVKVEAEVEVEVVSISRP